MLQLERLWYFGGLQGTPKRQVGDVPVIRLGGTVLPPEVEKVLSRGPKYSVEAPVTKHELLATAHSIADKVHAEERERCRQECVETVQSGYKKKDGTRMMRRIAGYMKESGHALMLADKDGSFVVMPQGLFGDKALAAVKKNFRISDVKPPKAKQKAVALLEDLKLDWIRREVKNNKVHALTVFFSAKSHKVDCPFRAIVTERGTWQATVSRYLQRQLTGLAPEDPYKIASSDRLVGLLQDSIPGANSGFSVDIEELFYSIPHEDLFKALTEMQK
ncbi:hypothetical protein HPB52_016464 [Rhipicephalus sanguineus]|uniref:Tick transposon n=1 Tax=Rhipicephalus sanguineus TaxID=34632 RepID=A0A9D4Q719_RHISA|nr:hypothetical protein HPB52_016464 [Rhipicephalus sanguineus]